MAVCDRRSALDRSFLDLERANTPLRVAGLLAFEGGPLHPCEDGVDVDAAFRELCIAADAACSEAEPR
jgi:hypothetical protein